MNLLTLGGFIRLFTFLGTGGGSVDVYDKGGGGLGGVSSSSLAVLGGEGLWGAGGSDPNDDLSEPPDDPLGGSLLPLVYILYIEFLEWLGNSRSSIDEDSVPGFEPPSESLNVK